jgi:DNA-damage-inducible protein J
MAGTASKVRTNIYIDKEAKEKARSVFGRYGLSMSDAINLFLHMVAESGEMPFRLEIPNKVTAKVMREVMMGENLEDTSLEELIVEAKAQKA